MTKVLNLAPSPLANTKIHVSHISIPDSYLDPTQPPTKRTPFRQIRDVTFVKSVRLCLPARVYNVLYTKSPARGVEVSASHDRPTTKFSKVIMTLHDILQDHSLRTGSFTMLAQPHPASPAAPSMPSSNSTTMNFNKGTLTIEMPYSVSQRSGLGAAFRVTQVSGGGRKHEKQSTRYRVTIDLRQPNMVKGKAAFDRLAWASREVEGLREGRVWLVTDAESESHEAQYAGRKRKREDSDRTTTGPASTTNTVITTNDSSDAQKSVSSHLDCLSKHHPTTIDSHAKIARSKGVLIPSVVSEPAYVASLQARTSTKISKATVPDVLEEDIHDLVEYLDLLFLRSARITREGYGKIDPYLCRYTLPSTSLPKANALEADINPGDAQQTAATTDLDAVGAEDLTFIEYSGLLPSDFVLQLAVDLVRRSRSASLDHNPTWAALQVKAHPTEVQGGTDGYTILLQADSSTKQQTTTNNDENGSMDVMDTGATPSETKSLSSRRLKFATCFEFVDSIVA